MVINKLQEIEMFWEKGLISEQEAIRVLYEHLLIQQKVNSSLMQTLDEMHHALDLMAYYMSLMVLGIDEEE